MMIYRFKTEVQKAFDVGSKYSGQGQSKIGDN